MSNWRISSISGVLLAGYFIPTWATVAWHIVTSPVRGLFERPSVSVALYATDHLQLPTLTAVRFAWLLALGRITVVAFFALFLVLSVRSLIRKQGSGNEALAIALTIGSVISFASMLMASQVGEIEALRLHASELLVMIGTGIVMLFDTPEKAQVVAVPSESALEQAELGYNS
ncbi:hypothetical protein [Bradyrhizobium sp.]|jgi:hypothetical protein|uniref:hypothetical protein n=1 Tax=Bradyrhizobium sp. TaxID=376 RepID=UPI002D46D79B|nr:hypothetical protein [Bradyrhizobium sp.]HZR74409.1 hypothetical protein [Bradyrhizobium sp.]